mmetsp:Transcript_72366/g.109174  ORF Transcript_72366/g.109174 Transcript_72366/m.109174 type:complete len:90 (+) Transcript_72366:418-687(+)
MMMMIMNNNSVGRSNAGNRNGTMLLAWSALVLRERKRDRACKRGRKRASFIGEAAHSMMMMLGKKWGKGRIPPGMPFADSTPIHQPHKG